MAKQKKKFPATVVSDAAADEKLDADFEFGSIGLPDSPPDPPVKRDGSQNNDAESKANLARFKAGTTTEK